jgi:hypothetical protein
MDQMRLRSQGKLDFDCQSKLRRDVSPFLGLAVTSEDGDDLAEALDGVSLLLGRPG